MTEEQKKRKKAYDKKWKLENKDKVKAQRQRHYEKHKKERSEYAAQYRIKNREKLRKQRRDLYLKKCFARIEMEKLLLQFRADGEGGEKG